MSETRPQSHADVPSVRCGFEHHGTAAERPSPRGGIEGCTLRTAAAARSSRGCGSDAVPVAACRLRRPPRQGAEEGAIEDDGRDAQRRSQCHQSLPDRRVCWRRRTTPHRSTDEQQERRIEEEHDRRDCQALAAHERILARGAVPVVPAHLNAATNARADERARARSLPRRMRLTVGAAGGDVPKVVLEVVQQVNHGSPDGHLE